MMTRQTEIPGEASMAQAVPADAGAAAGGLEAHYRSQHGEDRLLSGHFGPGHRGYYVEVGAFNGVDLSNTYFFEQIGWTGVLVEPNPGLAEHCRSARPGSKVFQGAAVAPGTPPTVTLEIAQDDGLYSSLAMDRRQREKVQRYTGQVRLQPVDVPARTLDAILEEAGAPEGGVDFVSIDVEGYEWSVLQGFTPSRWAPRVILLERDNAAPPVAIARYLYRHGYRLARRTGVNDWYLRGEASGAADYARLVGEYYVLRPAVGLIKALARPVVRPVREALRRGRG